MRLTDLAIRKIRPPDKGQKTHFDEALPGFGVRVSQGGSKSYVVMYGPRRRLKTIGRFPDMKLADARREAKKVQSDRSLLFAEPVPSAPAMTFGEARERFLDASARKNRPRTTEDYRRHLHRHFEFTKPVNQISRSDVMSAVSKLTATPSEQSHAFVVIRTFMNWCVKQGIIEHSPVPALPVRTRSRERVLSADELAQVLAASAKHTYPYGPIVRLLLLTGQRRGEIAALEWDWIDEDARTITLPASLTKNGRTHVFPFGDLVQATLSALPRFDDYLFPSRSSKATIFNGWGKAKERFDADLTAVEPYTLHDLRRTFASSLASLGTPIHVTEKLLNHVSGTLSGVAAVYNRHSYMDEMREAIAGYETHLATLIARSG